MRFSGPRSVAVTIALAILVSFFAARPAPAQYQSPADSISIRADEAATWSEGNTVIIQLDSPATIQTPEATLSAKRAVLWLTPSSSAGAVEATQQQRAEIALIGEAKIDQPAEQLRRTGDRLFVTLDLRGPLRITSNRRVAEDRSASEVYQVANDMRPVAGAPGQRPWIELAPPALPTTAPATSQPAITMPRPKQPVNFKAPGIETTQTADDHVAFVLQGGVVIYQKRADGDLIELQAERAVMFTQLRSLREIGNSKRFETAEDAVQAAYLEGDVRVVVTPATRKRGEQRLEAERIYYDFITDRAVLTQAVVHAIQPETQLPITVRASIVRQLSLGEYKAEKVELSTSQFLTPTYSFKASRMYVRQMETGDPRYGTYTEFTATNSRFNLFGVPVFWLPVMSGSMTDRGSALRHVMIESNNRMGLGVRSDWGLFESLGVLPPEDLDIGYRLDYFQKRGPAGGLYADYQGGYITETTKDPWDFKGRFTSYIVNDHGTDRLGNQRRVVTPPDEIRGRVLWEHQHFFPTDWQVQLRAGFASDATFLEEFFEREFDTGQPHELSAYAKRQHDSEALTLLFEYPTHSFTTTANEVQEQVQVERLPEVGYQRIGDSLVGDQVTFFSNNRVGALNFRDTERTLGQQGFRNGQSPGIPSYAYTGTDDHFNLRSDFRQELDYPISSGQFKVVPYVFGRYTGQTDTPAEGGRQRLFIGSGLRINTSFWKTDDAAESNLFDVHRVRHVIEPEVNVFTSAQTRDQDDFFIYDEPVDAINDVTAVQLALHQRWQTKRGGAGQFRSVDFFSLNIEANLFANQPDEAFRTPTGFRGLFFNSEPEASLARNSLNADALWRVSDTTAVLADAAYNFDEGELATTSIGLAVQRSPRLSYFTGVRYIGQINSTIASLAATYQISTKYTVSFNQSFNLSERRNQNSSVTLTRHFDRLFVSVSAYYDAVNETSGFSFSILPEGFDIGVGSDALNQFFGTQ